VTIKLKHKHKQGFHRYQQTAIWGNNQAYATTTNSSMSTDMASTVAYSFLGSKASMDDCTATTSTQTQAWLPWATMNRLL